MSEEIKIVITLKDQTATIGVQRTGCDPVFAKVEGDLPAVLKGIPKLVEGARKGWELNARYPKCETPITPPAAPGPVKRQAETKKQQPAMF